MVTPAKAPTISTDFEHWLLQLNGHWAPEARERLRQAHEIALGLSPDDTTGLTAAGLLADLRLDHEAVCAALVHEAVASGRLSPQDLRASLGAGVTGLVEGLSRLEIIGDIHRRGLHNQQQLEGLRKMLLAMATDVRVVLIKLALRLCLMRTLDSLPEPARARLARETLDIFAPLANRLGIGQFKWELEDLSLRCLDPASYKTIARALDERRTQRERYINSVMATLRRELTRAGLDARISGRAKHIYSIWRKMQRKRLPFEQIFDVRAVRLLVDDVTDCYTALGVVHALWKNVPREFDDYIASPKENGYQSLHTAVIGPEGKTLEIQIRTVEMHHNAELGVAAHWRYKEGGKARDLAFERQISWLRRLLEWKDHGASADEFVDYFKAEVFHDRVYVVTPRGDIVDLAQGATPLDFAYHIHTEIGHRCRGAKINGRIVPLDYELVNGDHVDIITAREGGPSRNWLRPHLGYLRTSRARAKVRQWFRQQDRDKTVAAGRSALEQELQWLGLHARQIDLDRLAARFNFSRAEDLYAAIGNEDVTTASVANALQEQILPQTRTEFVPVSKPSRRSE
ncbi:MAG: bifunctional (p)ppGpp synthetase/guanosine-3',5'-bis(diphosphate) 3'-pyrophosphohydrolase, partial [Candidatus Competibacterales bacterium]|nr:bifunctional (p)ppGpp synthetase/guanosine-3',5'-bis(diphosphate) 3'-pyrophosphohydrolase [Candidatus Competibacterales bacterium]